MHPMAFALLRRSHLFSTAATLHRRHTLCSSSLVPWKFILSNQANIGGNGNYENLRMDGFRQFSNSPSSSEKKEFLFYQALQSLPSEEWKTKLIRLVSLLPNGLESLKKIDNNEHYVYVKRKHTTGELIKVVVTDRAGNEVESEHDGSHNIYLGVNIFKEDERDFSLGFITTACPADGRMTSYNMLINRRSKDPAHQIVGRDKNVSYGKEQMRFYCKVSKEVACKIRELLETRSVAKAPYLNFDVEDTFVKGEHTSGQVVPYDDDCESNAAQHAKCGCLSYTPLVISERGVYDDDCESNAAQHAKCGCLSYLKGGYMEDNMAFRSTPRVPMRYPNI